MLELQTKSNKFALTQFPVKEAYRYWPAFHALLEPMDHEEPLFISREDVLPLIISGRIQLWSVNDETNLLFTALTEIICYPREKVCNIFWASGSGAVKAIGLMGAVEFWAQDQGCTYIRLAGRKGWTRLLRKAGYFERHGVLFKRLTTKVEH